MIKVNKTNFLVRKRVIKANVSTGRNLHLLGDTFVCSKAGESGSVQQTRLAERAHWLPHQSRALRYYRWMLRRRFRGLIV